MKKNLFIYFVLVYFSHTLAQNNLMILKLSYGTVEIELCRESPNHVKRFIELADSGQYDGVVFHRVIDGLGSVR